jgi:hypothetical protein
MRVSTSETLSIISLTNNLYRKASDADPAAWKGKNFKFSRNTANGTLRTHLEKFHADEYIQLAQQNGWRMLLPKRRAEAASTQGIGTSEQGNKQQIAFSQKEFLRHLVNFIVADDQVCIRFYLSSLITTLSSRSTLSSVQNSACCYFY